MTNIASKFGLLLLLCLFVPLATQAIECDFPGIEIPEEERLLDKLTGVLFEVARNKDCRVCGIRFYSEANGKRQVALSDLSILREFPDLRKVRLPAGVVTDDWLKELAKIKKLEYLTICDGKVSLNGLLLLKKLHMKAVYFTGTKSITDECMEVVADWEELEELSLSGTSVTDEGIRTIRGLGKLRLLDLENSARCDGSARPTITDASVETIRGFKNLKELILTETCISPENRSMLEEEFPIEYVENFECLP